MITLIKVGLQYNQGEISRIRTSGVRLPALNLLSSVSFCLCSSFVSSNLLMWKAVTATKTGIFQVCVAVMEPTVKRKVPRHDLRICYKRPPPLTADAMTGQTHTQRWYAHLAGMLVVAHGDKYTMGEIHFCIPASFGPKQTKKWLSSIFCLCNLCLPLNCLSFGLHTVVILCSCCVTGGQVWRIRAGLFCLFSPLTHLRQWFMWHFTAWTGTCSQFEFTAGCKDAFPMCF